MTDQQNEKIAKDLSQPPSSNNESQQGSVPYGPEEYAENEEPVYRFVHKELGTEFNIEYIFHEAPQVQIGDVIEYEVPGSKIAYYTVESVAEEGGSHTVYLVKARNTLWKSALILAILGVSWYVIEYIINLIS